MLLQAVVLYSAVWCSDSHGSLPPLQTVPSYGGWAGLSAAVSRGPSSIADYSCMCVYLLAISIPLYMQVVVANLCMKLNNITTTDWGQYLLCV